MNTFLNNIRLWSSLVRRHTCSVCLDPLQNGRALYLWPCDHATHASCAETLLKCPLCEAPGDGILIRTRRGEWIERTETLRSMVIEGRIRILSSEVKRSTAMLAHYRRSLHKDRPAEVRPRCHCGNVQEQLQRAFYVCVLTLLLLVIVNASGTVTGEIEQRLVHGIAFLRLFGLCIPWATQRQAALLLVVAGVGSSVLLALIYLLTYFNAVTDLIHLAFYFLYLLWDFHSGLGFCTVYLCSDRRHCQKTHIV
jgi:hypothetical protein